MAVTSGAPASSAPQGPAARRAQAGAALGWGKRFLTLREGSIIVVTLITAIYFSTNVSRFLTIDNFKTLLPYFTPYAILAAGEVLVMINGEIDLSIGALYLFTPFLWDKFAGLGLVPGMILALVVAALIGAANGFAVAFIGISSFVTTLGALFVIDGVTLVMSHATPITTPGTIAGGTHLNTFSQIFGGGTYSELIWAVGIAIVLQVVLSFTRWGIYTVAVGGNRLGASEAGIPVRLVLIRNFMVSAMLAGFVGILESVRVTTATPDPSASNEILLLAISAAVIGGTLLRGGSGTVIGALIGALFLGVLRDGLTVKGVSASYETLWLGLAILVAMGINTYVQRVRTGSGRG